MLKVMCLMNPVLEEKMGAQQPSALPVLVPWGLEEKGLQLVLLLVLLYRRYQLEPAPPMLLRLESASLELVCLLMLRQVQQLSVSPLVSMRPLVMYLVMLPVLMHPVQRHLAQGLLV